MTDQTQDHNDDDLAALTRTYVINTCTYLGGEQAYQ